MTRVDAPRLRALTALVAVLALAVVALAGCGGSAERGAGPTAAVTPKPTAAGAVLGLTRDAEADKSFPLPEGTRGARNAPLPSDVPAARRRSKTASNVSPGAPTDAEIRRELRQMTQVLKDTRRRLRQPAFRQAALAGGGDAQAPAGAPDVVARVIAGGNAIARFPYVWGGGHGSFVDSAYDCSGSVSYALAAAGLLDRPLVSGALAEWGEPGPGRWITIYANAGHVFMYVGGLRFDTSGRDGPLGSRWQKAPRSLAGFTVRHPPGL
ncbi:MAG: peptidoglycan DL-endopeptidase CwlO [Solirubrobacteraceae bacterium]|nr:peptidoglycan DL-endopeptidase CwlO [Solirubrobacteraceae bacterium]